MLSYSTQVASSPEVISMMKSTFRPSVNLLALYNSRFDRIITSPELMVMPIFDRQFYMAHSIFDSMTCNKCKIPLLERIILRIRRSCELSGIDLPFPLEKIKEKIHHIASFCISEFNLHEAKFFIRLWISSGFSGFTLLPEENTQPNLYIVAFTTPTDFDLSKVYKEATVSSQSIKEGPLVHSKTSNYLINSLIAVEAFKKGALNGVMLDNEGFITECPIANLAFVWKNTRAFVIPKWEKVLKGSTLTECLTYIEKNLIPSGELSAVQERDLRPEDVYGNVEEMIVFGGGKVIAIGQFDHSFIRADLGPICRKLQSYLREEYDKTAFKVDATLYKPTRPSAML